MTTTEFESIDKGPRSIFEITILTQLPGNVDDLLNTTHESEEYILELIEKRGFRLGEGLPVDTPKELANDLVGFDLKRHAVINQEGKAVAAIGVLKGDKNKLERLNIIIDRWQDSQKNKI